MKRTTRITAAVLMAAALPFLFSCKHNNNNDIEDNGISEPKVEVIPADAVRNWTAASKATAWSVYGVEDLQKLSEFVNAGNSFEGKTITVKNDIIINKKVLSDTFEEPAEGSEPGTPNPNLKNLDSIGKGMTLKDDTSDDVAPFSGTFDGNGKVISGLYIYQGHQGLGFIGIADGATIKNVILVDACIINRNMQEGDEAKYGAHDGYDDDRFGGLVGLVDGDGATIENCLFAGVVGSQTAKDRGSPYEYVGGLVGRAHAETTATDCYVFARIYGSREESGNYVCGKEIENFEGTNINGDGNGVDASDFDADMAADILEAVKAVQANVQ